MATCGCGIDLGGIEDVFAKDYRCGDCSLVFEGFGYRQICPRCAGRTIPHCLIPHANFVGARTIPATCQPEIPIKLAAIKVIQYRDLDYETAKKEVASYFRMKGEAFASDSSTDLVLDYELVCKIMDDLEKEGKMEAVR